MEVVGGGGREGRELLKAEPNEAYHLESLWHAEVAAAAAYTSAGGGGCRPDLECDSREGYTA